MHDPKHHSKAKHIDTRNLYIRNDMIANGRITVQFVSGADNPADILTKQLPLPAWKRHTEGLGMDMLEAMKEDTPRY